MASSLRLPVQVQVPIIDRYDMLVVFKCVNQH